MATTTFDKNITLGPKAAKRLAEILAQPALSRPSNEELDEFWENNNREVKEWLSSHCKK